MNFGVMMEDLGEDGEHVRLALRVDRQSITLMDEFEEDEFETEFQRAAEERELAVAEGEEGADLYDAVYNNEDGDGMRTNPDARAALQGNAADMDEEFGMGYNAGGGNDDDDDDMEDAQPLPLDEDARKELEGAILGNLRSVYPHLLESTSQGKFHGLLGIHFLAKARKRIFWAFVLFLTQNFEEKMPCAL